MLGFLCVLLFPQVSHWWIRY